MTVRWRVFPFYYQILSKDKQGISACLNTCFARSSLENAGTIWAQDI